MTVSSLKSRLWLIIFQNSYLEIGICWIEFDKLLSPIRPIWKIANEKQQVLILNGQIFKALVIDSKAKSTNKVFSKYYWRICRVFRRLYKSVCLVSLVVNFYGLQLHQVSSYIMIYIIAAYYWPKQWHNYWYPWVFKALLHVSERKLLQK